MAIAHVQDFTEVIVSAGSGGSTSSTSTTAGNALFAKIIGWAVTTIGSVSDGVNTWAVDKTFATVGIGAAMASAPNITGGTVAVSVALNTTVPSWSFLVQEFSGVKTTSILDASDGDGDDTTSAPTASPSGINTTGNDLVHVVYGFDRNPSASGPSGWTGVQGGPTSGFAYYAYKIFTSSTSGERGAITSSPTHYDAVIAAYKPAASGPQSLSGAAAVDNWSVPAGSFSAPNPVTSYHVFPRFNSVRR